VKGLLREGVSELLSLLLAWAVLSFCFALRWTYDLWSFLLAFAISSLTVGLGFVLHELSHREVANRLGCKAEFRLWPTGLVFALALALLTHGDVVFAAPGAVHIHPLVLASVFDEKEVRKSFGVISLIGPLTNYALAIAFLALSFLGFGSLYAMTCYIGFSVNVWLALFNMLPIPPLDGSKVLNWSKVIWVSVFAIFLVTMFLPY